MVCILFCLNNYLILKLNYDFLNTNIHIYNNVFWKILFFLNNSNFNLLLIFIIKLIININNKIYGFTINFIILYLLYKINLNQIDISIFLENIFINKDLYNGILLIHPIITYITVVIYTSFNIFNRIKNKYNIKFFFIFKKKFIYLFIYCFIALLLGSFWAQQELNWGGWWNWDSVEIILLSICLISLFYIHIDNIKLFFSNLNSIYLKKYFYIFIFYFVVRSNFINSVHSFSISINLQKYVYVYITIIIALFITVFFLKNYYNLNYYFF